MTSRRAVSGYDQRVSRALQFVPGHMGGRVASAQPVRRRGGTVRRQAVGTAGAPPPLDWQDPLPLAQGSILPVYSHAWTGGTPPHLGSAWTGGVLVGGDDDQDLWSPGYARLDNPPLGGEPGVVYAYGTFHLDRADTPCYMPIDEWSAASGGVGDSGWAHPTAGGGVIEVRPNVPDTVGPYFAWRSNPANFAGTTLLSASMHVGGVWRMRYDSPTISPTPELRFVHFPDTETAGGNPDSQVPSPPLAVDQAGEVFLSVSAVPQDVDALVDVSAYMGGPFTVGPYFSWQDSRTDFAVDTYGVEFETSGPVVEVQYLNPIPWALIP